MLYVVPTPIGNLEDITLRALRVLREVHVIACEDTRTTSVLLGHYDIGTRCVSYHDHNERRRAPQLVDAMLGGEDVALVSDAGTPGISDPGFFLVRACHDAGVPVTVLPGASAVVTALVASGLPCERFCFEGFLPAKKGRRARLEKLASEERTFILYESPHRIGRTLAELAVIAGPERPAAVARELSKKFEEVVRGTLSSLAASYAETRGRGEFVVVVGPPESR